MDELIKRYLAGEEIEEEIILGHMPLARAVARRIARQHPHLKDDLIAEALLCLVKVVRRIREKLEDPEKAGVFIGANIRWGLVNYIHKHGHTIRMPRTEIDRQIEENGEISPPVVSSNYEEAIEEDPLRNISQQELINKLKLTDYEIHILYLRYNNYTNEEIGKLVERHESTVLRHIRNIVSRYKDLQRSRPEWRSESSFS
jgi:RNA polymerase sigma factor (sigma-70 family)